MEAALSRELAFYQEHQDELVRLYDGRVIAIRGEEVLGAYDSYVEARDTTLQDHEPGTFMLQKVSAGENIATFRRVAF